MKNVKVHYQRLECDMAMRRAKERYAKTAEDGTPAWRCNSKCRECICCIGTTADGVREHVRQEAEA